MPLSDIEIARQAKMQPIENVAAKIGITRDQLLQYGPYKAKLSLETLIKSAGKLVRGKAMASMATHGPHCPHCHLTRGSRGRTRRPACRQNARHSARSMAGPDLGRGSTRQVTTATPGRLDFMGEQARR